MQSEYLVFNLAVLVPVVLLGFFRPTLFVHRWRAAWSAVWLCAIPYVAWDTLVVGRHWQFNPTYVIGVRAFGLPIEEMLFFFTMPFACLFSWHSLFRPERHPRGPDAPWWPSAIVVSAVPLGLALFLRGLEYTGLALTALGASGVLDLWLGTRLLSWPRFLGYLGFVGVLTAVFNGYLTARPIVLYGERYQVGLRLGTIPIEDFVYGWSLVVMTSVVYERLRKRWAGRNGWTARWIEGRLGGYRQIVVQPDPSKPLAVDRHVRVAVIGGGLAGMTAAVVLAERGVEVVLREKSAYLGGKVGAWREEMPDGTSACVEHGFHAFFRHYYNLNRLLQRLGVARHYRAIDDYLILTRDGGALSFKDVSTTPGVNLLSLAQQGVYRFREMLHPRMKKMEAMLQYDAETTFRDWDQVSFETFSRETGLPPKLRLAFSTFARAFFAQEDRMSMAEMIKAFHFYYLSNDAGLLYDYLEDDYDRTLLEPFRRHFAKHSVKVECGRGVETLRRGADGRLMVDDEPFDHVVLATDAVSARRILLSSGLASTEAPEFGSKVAKLRSSQRYSVLRLWMDRDVAKRLPVFVITERLGVLDAVAFCHRCERASENWAQTHGGGVFELHCYAVPDDVPDDAAIRQLLIGEFEHYFPEMRGACIVHESLQVRDDFAAFHVGMGADRPAYDTPVRGLVLAGDWVKLPWPAMLMEAACMSGLLAANRILQEHGARAELVEAVPSRGLLAR